MEHLSGKLKTKIVFLYKKKQFFFFLFTSLKIIVHLSTIHSFGSAWLCWNMLLNPSRTLLILLAIVCYKICRYAVQNTTSCPCLTVCKISGFYFGWINLSTFLALTLLFFWQDDEVVLQSVATIQKEHRKFCLAVEGLGNRLCYLESTSEAKVRMPKSFVYCATEEHSKSDVVYICWLHIKLKFIATYIQSCLPVADLCNCLVIESVRLLQTGLQQEKKFSV